MICPEKLSPNDIVLIVTPSGAIDAKYIDQVCPVLERWGLTPKVMPHAKNQLGRYCGTVEERLSDLQQAMDDAEAKAILCSRGGYGIVHLLEKLDFSEIKQHPKWLIGYSDITALHQAFFKNGLISVHAPMAKHLSEDTEAIASSFLKEILFGTSVSYQAIPNPLNRVGECTGQLIGGNLSVMCGLIGTPYLDIPEGAILFLEDIGERPYQIDRMMWQLKLSGVYDRISGLIVGRFTDYDEDPLMYAPVRESIGQLVSGYTFPVCFDFPVGHVVGNFPLLHGAEAVLDVSENGVSLKQKREEMFF